MYDIRLIEPDIRYKDSYVEALKEGLHPEHVAAHEILLAEKDFRRHIENRRNFSAVSDVLGDSYKNRLVQEDLWLVCGARFLGIVSIRPVLLEYMTRKGGHIGYSIRKSERGRGYGKLILKLALPRAKAIGLTKALVTCQENNAASIRIIEGAGGVLQDKVTLLTEPFPELRYWIEL